MILGKRGQFSGGDDVDVLAVPRFAVRNGRRFRTRRRCMGDV